MRLARPASSPNVTLCERQNPGAPELTRARTHNDPVASSLPELPRKPALPPLTGAPKLSQLRTQPRTNPEAEESRRTSLLSPLPARRRRPIPRPEPRSFPPHPTPLGYAADRGRSRACPGLESRFQHFGQRPDARSVGLAMASVQQGEKQLFEKFWRGTFKAVATPRPESIIVASITARKPLPR